MPIRNSPRAIEDLSDLNRLDELVVDKRLGKRASAKKNRRNRHYEKQFIRNSLTHHLELDPTNASDQEEPKGEPSEIDRGFEALKL